MRQFQDCIREESFSPYLEGKGPTFTLRVFELGGRDSSIHHTNVGYKLTMTEGNKSTVIFEGDDVGIPNHTAIDSDDAVNHIMGWLTLREGDTDSEFFENDTEIQKEYRNNHAESLSMEVMNRFGEL